MRTVTYGAACSLDGFIAGPNGEIDWLHMSSDAAAIMAEYWRTIDTILMGRRTWDFSVAMGAGGSKGMSTYVFSRTLESIDRAGVQLVTEDAGEFVRRLKAAEGKGICVMGGGDFARSLQDAGVIDEIGLNIHPILLGSGIPLFRSSAQRAALELAECRPIGGGCVHVRYRVRQRQEVVRKRRSRARTSAE